MNSRVIIGVPVAAIIVLVIASQIGGESEINEMPIATEIDNVDDTPIVDVELNCLGEAQCFAGVVTEVIDGDTLKIDGQSIRFSLASAPELQGYGGIDSKNFIETLCPPGSTVIIDEDDGQVIGSYGRMVALIHCNDVNLNSELLDSNLGYLEDRFCDSSEFAKQKWAQKHGCE